MSDLDELLSAGARLKEKAAGAEHAALERIGRLEARLTETIAKLDAYQAAAAEQHERQMREAEERHQEREAKAEERQATADERLAQVLRTVIEMADSVERGVDAVKLLSGKTEEPAPNEDDERWVCVGEDIDALTARVAELEKAGPSGSTSPDDIFSYLPPVDRNEIKVAKVLFIKFFEENQVILQGVPMGGAPGDGERIWNATMRSYEASLRADAARRAEEEAAAG